MADSISGLLKAEVINFLGPWMSANQVEWETLKRTDWYNTERLRSAIGYITPRGAEETFYVNLSAAEKATQLLNQRLSGKPGAVQTAEMN